MSGSISLEQFNQLSQEEAKQALTRCCGASRWVNEMNQLRPFHNKSELLKASTLIWNRLGENDWREAFSHHPKIGDLKSLEKKFANTKNWAEQEQKGTHSAPISVLNELALANQNYQNQFGFIFIVCATGKTAEEMLALLKVRQKNSLDVELQVAAKEQDKITQLRLEKLIHE